MKLYSLLAALALLAVVAAPPVLDQRTAATEVQPAAFQSVHGSYFMPVTDTSTHLQNLFKSSPVDTPDGATVWELVRNPELMRS
jgi:hypothetical protein